MKNILLNFVFILTINAYAQVGIETLNPHPSAVLDFPEDQNKGIILPMVSALPTGSGATNGTFVIDKTDGVIKVRENGTWRFLSRGTDLSAATYDLNPSAETGNGVIIGATSSAAEGVLVLESTNQGLMLPKVASPHLNIRSPYPGLICYDTDRDEIAIFNGTGWFYWK